MGEDSRRQRRIAVALEVRVRGVDRYGLPFEETTLSDNVSRGGCLFETSREVALGAELEIEILRRPVGRRVPPPFLTKGVVMRAVPEEQDRYTLGIQFTGPHFPTFSGEDTTAG